MKRVVFLGVFFSFLEIFLAPYVYVDSSLNRDPSREDNFLTKPAFIIGKGTVIKWKTIFQNLSFQVPGLQLPILNPQTNLKVFYVNIVAIV